MSKLKVETMYMMYIEELVKGNDNFPFIELADPESEVESSYKLEDDLIQDLFVTHFSIMKQTVTYSEILEVANVNKDKKDYIDRDNIRDNLHSAYIVHISANNIFKDEDFLDTSLFHTYVSHLLDHTVVSTEIMAKIIYKNPFVSELMFSDSIRSLEEV